MSIGQRIKEARRGIKLTQKELAKKVGMAQGSLSELETGESQSTTLVASLAAALGVSALWLENGKGPMSPGATQASDDPPFAVFDGVIEGARPVRVGEPESIAIPLLRTRVRAGIAQFNTEHDVEIEGNEMVPRALIESMGLNPVDLVAIRVRGQSMEPMMFEDDVVVIDKSSRAPINREIFALNFDNEACVKQMIFRNNQWYLHSMNADYGPINARSKDCNIVGRVVIQPARLLTGRL